MMERDGKKNNVFVTFHYVIFMMLVNKHSDSDAVRLA